MGSKDEASNVEKSILDYLAENPAAEDTLEGIVEWWLLQQDIVRTTAQVEAALARLVSQNLVNKNQGSDGRVYFSIGSAGP